MMRLPGSDRRPVVLLGGSGLLGQACAAYLAEVGVLVGVPAREEVDLSRPEQAEAAIAALRPRLVINTAAFADVTRAEQPENHEQVFTVNRDGAAAVARACARLECGLIHVSTDYVFDGRSTTAYREDDDVNPLQIYGESKLAGEREVAAAWPSALIARTSTLFGPGHSLRVHYVDAILTQAARFAELLVVETPVSSPCYTPDLARALLTLAEREARGVVHVANGGECSRLELARAVVELAGLAGQVEVRTRPEEHSALRRPGYSALDGTRHALLTGHPLRHWKEALAEYIEQRRAKETR